MATCRNAGLSAGHDERGEVEHPTPECCAATDGPGPRTSRLWRWDQQPPPPLGGQAELVPPGPSL